MVNIVVYERVKDHAKWLKIFQNDAPNRKGSMGGTIYQFSEDPNRHYIVYEWDDKEATAFMDLTKTPMMKKIFEDAGVVEQTFKLCKPMKFTK